MLVMIKTILYERTVAVCASMNFGKGLGKSEPWGDSRWSRWRKKTMKTGIRIKNISKKNCETLAQKQIIATLRLCFVALRSSSVW